METNCTGSILWKPIADRVRGVWSCSGKEVILAQGRICWALMFHQRRWDEQTHHHCSLLALSGALYDLRATTGQFDKHATNKQCCEIQQVCPGWEGTNCVLHTGRVEIMRALSTQRRAGQPDRAGREESQPEIDQDLRQRRRQPKCCYTPPDIPQIASASNWQFSSSTSPHVSQFGHKTWKHVGCFVCKVVC